MFEEIWSSLASRSVAKGDLAQFELWTLNFEKEQSKRHFNVKKKQVKSTNGMFEMDERLLIQKKRRVECDSEDARGLVKN